MTDVRSSQFLAAFREYNEPLCLRSFEPRGAPKTPENCAEKYATTLFDLTQNRELQRKLKTKNKHGGIYFVVNVGGDTDASITRFTACFAEIDDLPIPEQHARFDAAPLRPSIRVETRKSVHSYWLLTGACIGAEWREGQEGLINYFRSDPKIINASRVMRVPGFNHVHLNGSGPEYKPIVVTHFEPERRYTTHQLREAFPAPQAKEEPQGHSAPTSGHFDYHEDRHDELCQRIMARGKRNSKGNWDARCLAHNGNGKPDLSISLARGQ